VSGDLQRWLRDHWGIEDRLHWVRDVTLGEDLHLARTSSGPHALAISRNLLISLPRLSGHTSIACALRHHARHPDQAIALVASEMPTTQ
jgi:hypothetical protein